MAATSKFVGIVSSDHSAGGANSISVRYLVEYDQIHNDAFDILSEAHNATGTPVPRLRTAYPGRSDLFVESISHEVTTESRLHYIFNVTYNTPNPNSQDPAQQDNNPVLRPGTRNIDYVQSDYVVRKARNTVTLSHGDAGWFSRTANTLGPIVNAAGKQPDAPIMDTEFNAVLVWTKNYQSLEEIDEINRDYKRSTNIDEVFGYKPRTLKYLYTESLGQQFENEIEYWPGITRVEVLDTTDLVIDNIGYEYWDEAASKYEVAKDKNNDFMGDPIALTIEGGLSEAGFTELTYRHLNEIDYAPLFT